MSKKEWFEIMLEMWERKTIKLFGIVYGRIVVILGDGTVSFCMRPL